MDITTTIQSVISTLNMIEIKGRDNIDRMLGVMIALQALLQAEFEKHEEPAEETTAEE